MSNPRDVQFLGFAKLLYEDVYSMFRNLAYQESDCDDETAAQTRQGIQACFAERAYDLACHVLYETAYGFDLFNIPDRVNEIPDLTKLPEVKP